MTDEHVFFDEPHGPRQLRRRGYLPHLESDGATYFVTFRTADSLPTRLVEDLRARKARLSSARDSGRQLLGIESARLKTLSNWEIEGLLDNAVGCCPMHRAECADIVAESLQHWNGVRYTLFAWAVMPNHVHVIFTPSKPYSLSSVVTTWKSFTANRINRVLNQQGSLWQREYFDRLLRDRAELQHAIDYVLDNPAVAGLKEWRWLWKRSDA
jgi:REP element-mobilizing transposase RayT